MDMKFRRLANSRTFRGLASYQTCERFAKWCFVDKRDQLQTNCLKSPLNHLPICTSKDL